MSHHLGGVFPKTFEGDYNVLVQISSLAKDYNPILSFSKGDYRIL